MERKIGEIFEFNGEWYQCVIGCWCDDCAFSNDNCEEREKITLENKLTKEEITGLCFSQSRDDSKSVIFKKLEKVGKPYEHYEKFYQCYKLPMETEIRLLPNNCYPIGKDNLVEMEIKQKEDMEGKKIKLSQDDIDWLKKQIRWAALSGYITYEEDYDRATEEIMNLFIPSDTEYSISEKIGKNLKPFDLEAAKAGKPVCTKDGRKARVICFDRNDLYPIVALIGCEDGKEIIGAYSKEGQTDIYEIKGTDLMMLSEKKEGWVNVYHGLKKSEYVCGDIVSNTKEEAIQYAQNDDTYITTVKIEWEE